MIPTMVTSMLIKKIQFDNLRFNAETARHAAVIILTTDECTMCLHGSAQSDREASRAAIAAELVKDALRQVARMPEFRGGKRSVSVCQSATQEFRQTA